MNRWAILFRPTGLRNGSRTTSAQSEPNALADMQSTSTRECSSPSSIFAGMLSPGLSTHSSNHTFSLVITQIFPLLCLG